MHFDTMFKEILDMCKDITNDIWEYSELKCLARKRDEALLLIKENRAKLLAARGFSNEANSCLFGATIVSIRDAVTLLANVDPVTINRIISYLQTDYQYLTILNLQELHKFSDSMSKLLNLPAAPRNEILCLESKSFRDKRLRQIIFLMADIFLADSKEYAAVMKVEISRQKQTGRLVDLGKIEGVAIELLEEFERRLTIENISLKLFLETQGKANKKFWLTVRSVLLLSAGIHSVVALVFTDSCNEMTKELMIDLISCQAEAASREEKSFLASNYTFL